MKRILLITIVLFFIVSCAPPPFKPFELQRYEFEKTQEYSIQEELKAIPKPDEIVRLFVRENVDGRTYTLVDTPEEATHVLLAPKEFAKVNALKVLAVTYKQAILEQEKLVNVYISEINALKELLTLEQKKSEMFRELWISSENAYRQEEHRHKWDNRINRTAMYIVTIGSVVAVLLAI